MSEDIVYEVVPTQAALLEADLPTNQSDYNTLIYARSACATFASEIACDGSGQFKDIDIPTAPNVPVYVWVDGMSGKNGEFMLVLDPNK